LHVLLYFSVFKLVLVIYPIKFILKMTNNIRDITGLGWRRVTAQAESWAIFTRS
jgi:hypothetical protein